jgi:PadR family transcriptional regulator PadR
VFTNSAVLLDACVLAVLKKGRNYGYELTQNVKAAIEVSESTLYPVLRRLQKDGFLSVYDEAVNGRNRRYYELTAAGRKKLSAYIEDWKKYKKNIDDLLNGDEK